MVTVLESGSTLQLSSICRKSSVNLTLGPLQARADPAAKIRPAVMVHRKATVAVIATLEMFIAGLLWFSFSHTVPSVRQARDSRKHRRLNYAPEGRVPVTTSL